jgi:H+/Cl- antiporter ClcA
LGRVFPNSFSIYNKDEEVDMSETLKKIKNVIVFFLKWMIISIPTGIIVGFVGVGFLYCVTFATKISGMFNWFVWLLPVGGIAIIFMYRICGVKDPKGTNLVLQSIRSQEPIPFKMAPLIFIGTCITHLFGGSAGREGAALQLGGSVGYSIGKAIKLKKNDLNIMTMCGMSAAFTGLFGTPIASTVFAMEVTNVGIMYYSAIIPCAMSSFVAEYIRWRMGFENEFIISDTINIPDIRSFFSCILIAILCAAVSCLFCYVLHNSEKYFAKLLHNQYLRIAAGGIAIALLTLVFGRDYLGTGSDIIVSALSGNAKPEAFILKLLFTAITLGVGFKGGEIVPSFFVGATFGCVMAGLLGISGSFGAQIGMLALFCGVTNCPLTAIIIGIELFGHDGSLYYMVAVAISYILSGYLGLYSKQKVIYSKYNFGVLKDDENE